VSAFVRRFCSFALLLAFFAPTAVDCAGWKPSAEARKACCAAGLCARDTIRPGAGSTPMVSQSEADDCCAASETPESDSPSSAQATVIAAAELLPAVFPIAIDRAPAPRRFERVEPPQLGAIPRHLLLSVFLV
jgi:hypothetical protein